MSLSADETFMLVALEEAKKAKENGDLPFGAVVVFDGEIVGRGKAEDVSTGDVTAHAELQALRMACKKLGTRNLQDCVMYSTSEPCMMCAAGTFQAKIATIKIGLSREDLPHILRQRKLNIAHLAADSGYEISITRDILKNEILELFDDLLTK